MWKRIPTGGFKKNKLQLQNSKLPQPVERERDWSREGAGTGRPTLPSPAAHCWEGPGPAFVASLAPRPAVRPLYPSRNTPSLSSPPHFLPLSTLIVFQSDKDLITREVDLEPEPLSERKRGPTSKKYFWKATVPRCCKGTLCLAIRTAALAFYVRVCPCVCCFSGV